MSQDQIIVEPLDGNREGEWEPAIGPETLDFLRHSVPAIARESIADAAVAILSKGIAPTENGQETGLVVGYVQSGKTMSFETVAALAHDNGFQMVIVITGTSNPLYIQSRGRLRRDLQLEEAGRVRRWIHLSNPDNREASVQPMQDALDEWRDDGIPNTSKRTVLITVLKNHNRLRNLTNALSRLNLIDVPVLIIDDEADQASLNTQVAQGTESTTYRRLMALRAAIPDHTYLQYTATPQAPLLINIIDSLSPNFVRVLEPGDDYVGGAQFFSDGSPLIRVIPPQDVPTNTNPLAEPPDSLIEALLLFMVGVASGLHESDNTGNRSMFVSPSHRTSQHQSYYGWVRDIVDDWKRRLALPDSDPDRQALVEDLRGAHAELSTTVASLPSFDALVPRFSQAFRVTRVLEVNARGGATPEVDWSSTYGWIVVGGQAMDRGFTVEGLTVTYMPRGIGVGNADTIQQRARFFGYKRPYLGYCRVYLEQGTLDAFRAYVEHEEDIRKQLFELQNSGESLNDWKRAFFLDGRLSTCRSSVVQFDYMQNRFSDDWVSPRLVLAPELVLQANRDTADSFVDRFAWQDDDGHADRTAIQRHEVAHNVPLRDVISDLLVKMRITGTTDTQRNLGLLLQLARALEDDPDETCTVYRMSPSTRRERGVDEDGEITNLFQGEAPVFPRELRGTVYPGDRSLHDDNVTVQIHFIDLTREDAVVATRVPVAAVWVPARMARGWLAQQPQK